MGRAREGPPGHRPAQLHRAPHDHRLARPERAEHRQGARLRARRGRGGGHQEDPRASTRTRPSRSPETSSSTPAAPSSAASRPRPSGRRASTPGRRATGSARRSSTGCAPARSRPAGRRRCPSFPADEKGVATRKASGEVLTAIAPELPELWGGSADLAGSNNTTPKGEPSFIPAEHSTKEFSGDVYGRVLHFGIREHGMGSIMNGIALHGGTRVYGGTFLTFSDYMRRRGPARRADAAAGHLRLDPRLDRPRRGRPDPPAGRAPRRPAGDPGPRRRTPRGRQRDGRGLEGDPGEHRPTRPA